MSCEKYCCGALKWRMIFQFAFWPSLRFLRSTRTIYVQHKEIEDDRQRLYEMALQSQMLQERRPMTVVSLAIKFNAACFELGKFQHPGVDVDSSLQIKQQLLLAAMDEFDSHCTTLNRTYMLSSLQRDAVFNLVLHSSPTFLRSIQGLLDTVPEKTNPWKLKVLQTKRWILGGQSSKVTVQDQLTVWAQVLQMNQVKQCLLAEIVNFEVRRALRSGRSKSLTLEEFMELCDYSCWVGHCLSNPPLDDPKMLASVRSRCNPALS